MVVNDIRARNSGFDKSTWDIACNSNLFPGKIGTQSACLQVDWTNSFARENWEEGTVRGHSTELSDVVKLFLSYQEDKHNNLGSK